MPTKKADPLAPWRKHVAAQQKKSPELSLKDVLKQAKLTYTKGKEVSAEESKKAKPKPKPKKKVAAAPA